MKKLFFILFLLFALGYCQAQDSIDDFNSARQQFFEEFFQFRQEINEEYIAFLRQTWGKYELREGLSFYDAPKPDDPFSSPSLSDTSMLEIEIEEFSGQIESPEENSKEELAQVIPPKKTTIVHFYGLPLEIKYDLDPCRLKKNAEKEVADLWEFFSKSNYASIVFEMRERVKKNGLNDWALYKLAESISNALPELQNKEARLVFTQFLLFQYGFDVRIGLAGNQPILLMPTFEKLYDLRYWCKKNTIYYLLEKEKSIGNRITMANISEGYNKTRKLSMQLKRVINLGYSPVPVKSEYDRFSADLILNKFRIDFFRSYPYCDLSVYARAAVDNNLSKQLLTRFRTHLEGKDLKESLNWLLQFVQYAFKYKIDQDQFGYEKPFFVEEILYYPYSDCEDRSIFFSWLVRKLLNLDVVLLDYPNHIATAVRWDKSGPGLYFRYKDERYVMCDPTNVGEVGECISEYKQVKPGIIEIASSNK